MVSQHKTNKLRYNVHYTVDDAMQPDVREVKIRATAKTQKKKKAAAKKKSGKKSGKRAAESDVATPAKKKKKSGSKGKKKVVEEQSLVPDFTLDEGDPPWRTTGHEYLMREVQWTPEGGDPTSPCVGTVVAYIADTDVDSEGNPGFTCSNTGKPANLFHVVFDEFEQDFEQFELEECFTEE